MQNSNNQKHNKLLHRNLKTSTNLIQFFVLKHYTEGVLNECEVINFGTKKRRVNRDGSMFIMHVTNNQSPQTLMRKIEEK